MKTRLCVCLCRRGGDVWRVVWRGEDGDATVDRRAGRGAAPCDRDDWEAWTASRAAATAPGVKNDGHAYWWATKAEATAALRVMRAALQQERPLPDWAQRALAEGWKPPKGWRA